jgi:hypothetical protein
VFFAMVVAGTAAAGVATAACRHLPVYHLTDQGLDRALDEGAIAHVVLAFAPIIGAAFIIWYWKSPIPRTAVFVAGFLSGISAPFLMNMTPMAFAVTALTISLFKPLARLKKWIRRLIGFDWMPGD